MPGRPLFAGHPAARRPRSQLVVSSALGCSLLITITDLTAGDSVLVSGQGMGGVGGARREGHLGREEACGHQGAARGSVGMQPQPGSPALQAVGLVPWGVGGPSRLPKKDRVAS